MRHLAAVLGLALAGCVGRGPGATLWLRTHDGDAHLQDRALDVEIDPTGDVVVAGYESGADANVDLWLRKYDTDGQEVWTVLDPAGPETGVLASGIAIDDVGNIAVVGSDFSLEEEAWDILVRRYAPDGSLLWSRTHAGAGGLEDMGVGAACDEDGRIVAVGYVGKAVPNGDERQMTLDAWVAAYDSTGEQLWQQTHDGPGAANDAALDAAIAANGDVLVAGYESATAEDTDVWLSRYDSHGETVWMLTYDGPGEGTDRGTSVTIDPDGNILLSGHIDVPGEAWNALVRKHEPNGDPIWTRTYDGQDSVFDAANDIATDAEGNVFVTGFEYVEGNTQDVLVRRYDSDGDAFWTLTYSGDAGGSDSGAGIATDADGFVYVAGSCFIREVEVAPGDCDPEDIKEDGTCPLLYDYDAFVRKIAP
jgi:uncharacterized delta-60 repeat protein